MADRPAKRSHTEEEPRTNIGVVVEESEGFDLSNIFDVPERFYEYLSKDVAQDEGFIKKIKKDTDTAKFMVYLLNLKDDDEDDNEYEDEDEDFTQEDLDKIENLDLKKAAQESKRADKIPEAGVQYVLIFD